jgi:hypothetical protein
MGFVKGCSTPANSQSLAERDCCGEAGVGQPLTKAEWWAKFEGVAAGTQEKS